MILLIYTWRHPVLRRRREESFYIETGGGSRQKMNSYTINCCVVLCCVLSVGNCWPMWGVTTWHLLPMLTNTTNTRIINIPTFNLIIVMRKLESSLFPFCLKYQIIFKINQQRAVRNWEKNLNWTLGNNILLYLF